MTYPEVLVAIVNHENTGNALSLARGFRRHAETLLIDSGSELSEQERAQFDILLPNVHYSGLFNESLRQVASREGIDALLFICSDVLIEQPAAVLDRMTDAFSTGSIGIYTPSNTGSSGHVFCRTQTSSGLREIPFVDGYLFGVRREVLERCPQVDLNVNPTGWGVDVYAGYLAASMGLRTVVDDRVSIYHPAGSGYDRALAFRQMVTWLASHGDGSLRYYNTYRRLMRLSRFKLSRITKGKISPLESMLFRWMGRL